GPELRRELAGGLLRTPERALLLLEAVEDGMVPVPDLDPATRRQLRDHPAPAVKDRAVRVLGEAAAPEPKETSARHGRSVGPLPAGTGSSLALKGAEGRTDVVLRADVEEVRSLGISLMPEGLERVVGIEEMADLLAFLKGWRYLSESPSAAESAADGR